jgi:sporulation protein YlmC with PRC-barrel domain
MRFSETRHRTVLDTSAAVQVGRVEGFVIDAGNHRVQAVVVGKNKDGNVLAWADVQSFGPDAVTVQSGDAIRQRTDDSGGELVGVRVLTARGHELGIVDDVEFDTDSGTLVRIHLAGGADLDGADLLAIGSYAVIVRDVGRGHR